MVELGLDGAAVLVTGGTGSFGKHFVSTLLARHKPRRVVVYSRGEARQFEMAEQYSPQDYPALRYFIGDVRDRDRLAMALRGIDFVVHAAALKQVPTAEYNPFECIHTNVIGAENVVHAALQANVKRVVALSTDKACNPINLYGASKLASDKIFIAANNLAGSNGTRFSIVRYGNVLGSRGSVVPVFRRYINEGREYLPITDPRMTRFWISLQQGVDFVISALEQMDGGEIMVPKIPSMRLAELATAMAPDVPQRVVGIRPGEKLHEVLVSSDDARSTVDRGDRYLIRPSFAFWHDRKDSVAGTPVAEDFAYTSDRNSDWLTADRLRAMLGETNEVR